MRHTELNSELMRQTVGETIRAPGFRRASFAGVVRGKPSVWVRVTLRPIDLAGERHLQFSYFDGKKDVTKNYRGVELDDRLQELLDIGHAAVHLAAESEEIDIRISKKGKISMSRRKSSAPVAPSTGAHNRVKHVPLPEGKADRLLEVMGILTRDGHVRPTMRAKFTQINECLKLLIHVIDDAGLRGLGRPVEILDCGCGSSYLTLAAHHYLTEIAGIPARVMGVDVNEEVIRKSIERSDRLGSPGLRFACARIESADVKPDVVLALHACDTATDDAIALAAATNARVLLSAPCCHHHLNARIRAGGAAEVLRPLLRHGILHQRTADLVTDAFRALALRIMGYQTDVIEFISVEHTARNLMIRAVQRGPSGDLTAIREYLEMKRFWGVVPYIETALGSPFETLLEQAKAAD